MSKAGESRVWLIRGSGPGAELEYIGCAKAADPSWNVGGVKQSECPHPEVANEFVVNEEWREASERASTGIQMRYSDDLSTLLALARAKCSHDIHILWGSCKAKNAYLPPNWSHIDAFPFAAFEQWSAENYGALESGEQNAVNESSDVTAREVYQIGQLGISEILKTTVVREIVAVDVCDSPLCGGDCGEPSTGCSKVYAVQIGTGATPGTLPSVVYVQFTRLGAVKVSGTSSITTMFSNETPADGRCMGQWFVVPARTSNSLHYTKSADMLLGTNTWTENITGFVAGGEPRAMWVANAVRAFVVGDGGYIYLCTDPQTGVSVLDPGETTVQDLYDVHGTDENHVVAVGTANAVVYTTNGVDWFTATGPAVGTNLMAVWCWSNTTWIVGTNTGKLYYTLNSGVSWTEIVLPGSLTNISDIHFTKDGRVGYIAGDSGGTAKVLRSTAHGIAGTWYVLPEGAGTIPSANKFNDLAVCEEDPNTFYAGGLASASTDGILIKGAA